MAEKKGRIKMREIKFRAWNEEFKMMFYSKKDDFCHLVGEKNSGLCGSQKPQGSLNYMSQSGCSIMQFTGLLDKNGKEIFEGDIVSEMGSDCSKCTAKDGNGDCNMDGDCPIIEKSRDIVTMERFPGYWLKDENFGYEGEDLVPPRDCIVIGNIYENPES